MNSIWKEACIYSPSLICLDMCNLESQIRQLEEAGIKMLHIDIIDGHFSPSMPLGFETLRQLRAITDLEFEVHIMVTEPDFFVDELLDIGVQQIVFHVETTPHIDGMLNKIKSMGVKAGVALKPSTPLCSVEYILEKCDTILLMLINPGYASSSGEDQIIYADKKIQDLRAMIDERNLDALIEVYGRVSLDTIEKYGKKDVDIFVTGSTSINKNSITESLDKLNALRNKILHDI